MTENWQCGACNQTGVVEFEEHAGVTEVIIKMLVVIVRGELFELSTGIAPHVIAVVFHLVVEFAHFVFNPLDTGLQNHMGLAIGVEVCDRVINVGESVLNRKPVFHMWPFYGAVAAAITRFRAAFN